MEGEGEGKIGGKLKEGRCEGDGDAGDEVLRKKEHVYFFFFNDTATTQIYTLSLNDALPISANLPKECIQLW